ncbi:site-specific integrase [Amycolatopsis sp. WAC 04169]|nr:site-specific integrase [Amycolatopsis sp. WAC 04169]
MLSQTIPAGPTALDDAEAAARRMLTQVRERRELRTDVTLTELLASHLALLHASGTTRHSYQCMVTKHVQPLLGHLRLSAITPELLDHYYSELRRCRDHCRRPQKNHRCRPLAPATVRKIHYLLSGAYHRAVRWGWIDRSPTMDAAPPPKAYLEPQPPTPAEAAQIMDAAARHPNLGPLVWLAMVTGARRGELCALRWRHFDPVHRVLVIRASIAQVGTTTWEKDTKLHQRRHLALDADTTAMLVQYHHAQQHRAASVGAALTPDSFVFSSRADGATWRPPDSLTRQYRRLVTRLGIRTTLHKLRHYSATELIAAGVDVRTVAGRLGHSDGGTTLAYYAAWVREADQRASNILISRLPTPRRPLATKPDTRTTTRRPRCPYETIAAELRTAIADGTLTPGSALPTIQELATIHHVAPSTAHRAIAQLTRQHLITVTRGCRARVNKTVPST